MIFELLIAASSFAPADLQIGLINIQGRRPPAVVQVQSCPVQPQQQQIESVGGVAVSVQPTSRVIVVRERPVRRQRFGLFIRR